MQSSICIYDGQFHVFNGTFWRLYFGGDKPTLVGYSNIDMVGDI